MKRQKLGSKFRKIFQITLMVVFIGLIFFNQSPAADFRIGVLMLGEIRQEPLNGLKDGLAAMGYREGERIEYQIRSADGEKSNLSELAEEVIKSNPHVAIACGGIEADALKAATEKTKTPVVFLAVASSVDRGLVNSMSNPGTNLTGIDTNDTQLTEKRLWLIKKMFPSAKRVLIPDIPSIVASAKTVEVAMKTAPKFGLEIQVLSAETLEEMARKAANITKSDADVIYIGMAAPAWQLEKEVFFKISLSHQIPIMGINPSDLKRGAVASYAASRYEAGVQAARLVEKVLLGTLPEKIPVETPSELEFIINKWVVDRLGLVLPDPIWRLANKVENFEIR